MQRLNYGTIMDLRIANGEPVLDSDVRIIAAYQFPGQNEIRPEWVLSDFNLSDEIIGLIEAIHPIKSAVIMTLDVRAGKPRRMEVPVIH
jgi:hypothetical protein